jgi:predicted secreted protein
MELLRRYWGHGLIALCAALWVLQLFLPDQGVGFVTGIVVYLIVWWMVFFTVLPLRVRGQHEDGDIVPGSEPGAPTDPRIAEKMWLAASVTAVLWLIYFVGFEFGLVSLDAISPLRPPGEY